jgi:uncharacterized protein
MSDEVLEETIRQIVSQPAEQVSIGWQGGEPTIMGLDFFRKAVSAMERHGTVRSVGNGLQTNGILLDSEWANFLKRYRFLVGLSLDGPEHVHDRYRHTLDGSGTWKKVTDAARLLLEAGVEVNALSVINDYSVRFPGEIYSYFKETGLPHMQFIPCVEPDAENSGSVSGYSVSPEDFGSFLCTLFDLWLADFREGAPTVYVRFFESLLFSYADLDPPECTLMEECGNYLVVEHNGDMYACDFFVDPGHFLGNVMSERMIAALNSIPQRDFGRRKALLPDKCTQCEWGRLCRGGCPKDRMRNPADRSVNYLCEGYRAFFAYADPVFRKLIEEWRRKNAVRPVLTDLPGRNAPCPCGSGKKYKRCCGALT